MADIQYLEGTVVTLLDGVSANGDGAVFVQKELNRTFHAIISGTANCNLMVSLDQTNWTTIKTSASTEAYSNTEGWLYIKGNVSGYSSGTVTLLMGT